MSRYRNLAVLVIVIAAQLVLLAYQVRTKEDVSLLRSVTVTAVSPLAKGLDHLRGSSTGFLDRYILLLRVEQENEKLKNELDRMKLENQFLRTELTTADRVRALAMFQQQTRAKTVAARIIGTRFGVGGFAMPPTRPKLWVRRAPVSSSRMSQTTGVSDSTSRLAALMVVAIPIISSLWKMNGLNSSSAIFFGRPHWCSLSSGPTTMTERPE